MYSQRDEEAVILRELGSKGQLLDIGAYDGRTFSNSLALIERGWCGVLVEASPSAFVKLMEEHKSRDLDRARRDRVVLVDALVSPHDQPTLTTFHIAGGDAISSTQPDHVAKWSKQATFEEVVMLSLPVRDLIRSATTWSAAKFDFINIDVEGESVPIFGKILHEYQHMYARELWPKLYCVEFDSHAGKVMELCNQHGYDVIHRTDENMICRSRR